MAKKKVKTGRKANGQFVDGNKEGRGGQREFSNEEIKRIDQMAEDNCHMDTIALALGIPEETLKRRFGPYICQKRAEGRTMLRRAQRHKALVTRDTGMLCFLGKNDLNQLDKVNQVHSGEISLKPPAIT